MKHSRKGSSNRKKQTGKSQSRGNQTGNTRKTAAASRKPENVSRKAPAAQKAPAKKETPVRKETPAPRHSQKHRYRKPDSSVYRKNKLIVSAVILAFLLITEIVMVIFIAGLNFLPGGYFAAVIFLLLVVDAGIAALMLLRPGETGVHTARLVVGGVLSLVIGICCIWGSSAIHLVGKTIDSITADPGKENRPAQVEERTVSYSVFVLTEDPAQTLADAGAYRFGMTGSEGDEAVEQCREKISDELQKEIGMELYPFVSDAVSGLYDGKCRALILASEMKSVLSESESFSDFSQRARAIWQFDAVAPAAAPDPADPSASAEPAPEPGEVGVAVPEIASHPFVVYISGSDTRESYLSDANGNSDVNILGVVNPTTRQILLINTPRDYYVPNPAGNNVKDKLTHLGVYGVENSMKGLSALYGLDINYYAKLNFNGFQTFIDALGGVDVYSDYEFYASAADFQVVQGYNHMNGYQALGFVRERHNLPNGDNDRGKNQMKVISAVVDSVSVGSLLFNYAEILDSMQGMFSMSFSRDEISDLVKFQLSDMSSWNIRSFAATGTGASDLTYSYPGLALYVMIPNMDSVSHASSLAKRVLNGEKLTDEDLVMP